MSGKRLTLSPNPGAPIPPDRARRMRIVATGMLAVMAAVFVISGFYLDAHPVWGFVHAFAEAAMVGGIADWFAVTALFRHPFGIPIPHTAIIPTNKDRIADTMADFLRDNFLTPAVVARRMIGMNVAGAIGDFLDKPPKSEGSRIAAGAASLFADMLESLDPERMGGQVRAGLKATLSRIEVAPPAGKMIEAAIVDGRHRPLIDSVIRWVALALEDNEDLVREMIHRRANTLLRFTGLDERLANSVIDGLYKLLAETLVDPDHPIRTKVEESLEKLGQDLQHDPELRARVEKAKNDLLDNPALGDWWQGVWERARRAMLDTARNPDRAMQGEIGKMVRELGSALSKDPRLQVMVNRFARRTAVGVATRYGDNIVRLVSETVRRWDAQTITDRVEGAVGRDLQFIRINGTLVGGLVGLTLHALGYLF